MIDIPQRMVRALTEAALLYCRMAGIPPCADHLERLENAMLEAAENVTISLMMEESARDDDHDDRAGQW